MKRIKNIKTMICILNILLASLFLSNCHQTEASDESKTIMAVILTQNEEISLPYFLSFFQRLTYPKNKISLYIRSGNNQDKTKDILMAWIKVNIHKYRSINSYLDDKNFKYNKLVEESLEEARKRKFDYYWVLNQVSILTNQDVLQSIMEEKLTVAAPMVETVQHYYTNFWGSISSDFSYVRSDDYIDIYSSEKRGCHKVALLDSLFLVNLFDEKTKNLTFNRNLLENYNGPSDARIVFAESAKQNGISLHICNNLDYGRIMTPYGNQIESLQEVKNALHQDKILFNISDEFLPFMKYPKIENFGLDKTYVITLKRRPLKKQIMKERMKEVGLDGIFFEAIDGAAINASYLLSIGYRPHKNYTGISLTTGAIGCALSHYFVWEDVIKSNYSKVLILEDDMGFERTFTEDLKIMFKEIEAINLTWDLIYLARHPVYSDLDIPVSDTKHLISLDYPSYTNGAYMLSRSGVTKLYQKEFISNMLPVDDYLSMKYWPVDKRVNSMKNIHFPMDLKVFSINPLIVRILHYANGESDTITQNHLEAFGEFTEQNFVSLDAVSRTEL